MATTEQNHRRHDWTVAIVSFVAAVGVNGVLLAYGYGKLEQRVEAQEQWREELRKEWHDARERIEKIADKLQQQIDRK
jgi:hypothetical protein